MIAIQYITDSLHETGLFNNDLNNQQIYLQNIIMKFLMMTSNFKIHNVAPLILHLITHYISNKYFKLNCFFKEYLSSNKQVKKSLNNILPTEVTFDSDISLSYILNEVINGLKDQTYIFKFIIHQETNKELYIGFETEKFDKWYFLNLKTNKIFSNAEHNSSFKLILNERDDCIYIKIDFNNIQNEGLILMKTNNKKWLNTGLKFLKNEKTRIMFGCLDKHWINKKDVSKETKVILKSAYKKINKTNENLYKNF